MIPSRQYLSWYREIEKSLQAFFRLFNDLCSYCFELSIKTITVGNKPKSDFLCCCLTDNQLRDNWICLDPIQRKMNGINWRKRLPTYSILQDSRIDKGPCPALSCHGCSINSFRPPTCSTQLCKHMLTILHRLEMIPTPSSYPCQIEDLLSVQSPLNILFGIHHGNIGKDRIESYLLSLVTFTTRLKSIPQSERSRALSEAKLAIDQGLELRRK